ncbi:MAG: hypothetical protein M3422_03185 [Actinomycetota bacterium]|nr:hypothetical protein [Actinomycetota bacterium]
MNTPDKYRGPKLFDDLDKARAYDSSGVISAEVEVATPDGRHVSLSGGVPSADSIWRRSDNQDAGVLPEAGARVTAVEAGEVVFTNPGGGRWVLIR